MAQPPGELIASRFARQAEEVDRVGGRAARSVGVAGSCRVVWRRWGEGPAVVLLHGGSGAWTHWIRNVEPLAALGLSVLAPDMPGYGESDDVPLPHSARTIASILAESIGSAGLPRAFAMVGFSFGSVVAAHLANDARVRVGHLVLVGATGLGIAREREFDLRSWKRLDTLEQTLSVHRHNLRVLMVNDESALDEMALYLQAVNTERTRFISRFASRGDALPELLRSAGVPFSAVWGRHDVTAVEGVHRCEQRLREVAPGLRFDVVEGAGHWVQYEGAAQFNRLLGAHLGRG